MDETTFILYQLQQIEGWERPESDTTWSKFDAAELRSITIPEFASISKKRENQRETRAYPYHGNTRSTAYAIHGIICGNRLPLARNVL
jgi:hypothetical protein